MTSRATTGEDSPPRRDGEEDGDLRRRVQNEPLPAGEVELNDALSALAAVLLELRVARPIQGGSPTRVSAPSCPDQPHARGLSPPQHEETGP